MDYKQELIINFNDPSVCLNNIKELDIKLSPKCKNYIKLIHSCVMTVGIEMTEDIMAEICYRMANKIIKTIELETDIRFIRYKKSNYLLK